MSIKWRLTLWYVLILGVVLAGFSTFVYLGLQYSLQNSRLAEDRDLAQTMAQSLGNEEATFGAGFDLSDEELIRQIRGKDVYLRLVDAQGRVTKKITVPFGVPAVPEPRTPAGWVGKAGGRHIVVVNVPVYRNRAWSGSIQVFERLDTLDEFLAMVRRLLWLGSLLGLGVSFAGGMFFARAAFRPVERIVDEVERIGPHELDRRVEVGAAGAELQRLVGTFNGMLDRLAVSFDRQRHFAADASHELRTPLAAILGHAALIDKWGKEDPEVLKESVAFILKDARRMESIVNDLLLLAGTDAAEAPPGGAVGLREVAEEIVADARILAGERVVDLRPGGEVLVRAERDAVRRILTELLVNAVKYTGHGGRIEVTVAPRGDRGRMVVSDNGVGIPPDDLPHVFERFYRVDKARSRRAGGTAGGTGLGLSIVQSLAEAYHGRVSVTSTPGVGSKFVVEFPLFVGDEA